LASAAFLLFHWVRFAGRAVLRMPANLVGNGMLLSRDVLRVHPWDAFSAVEDLEYSIRLRLHGIRPWFAGAARIWGPVATSPGGSRVQRRRWEGGRFYVMRHYLARLIWRGLRRDWRVLDAALDLAVPPLGLLVLAILVGTIASGAALAIGLIWWPLLAIWLVALLILLVHVLAGLKAAHAPASTYRALALAPLYVLRKLVLYAGLLRAFDVHRWESEAERRPRIRRAGRFKIAGVPIDALGLNQVLQRMVDAIGQKGRMQVCTINLDFLVKAQRDPDMRRVFEQAELNVPDGLPVVWLGRLLGCRVPERVAGADLIPLLIEGASARGASVFFLGGEEGAGEIAARRLKARFPELIVAGCYEPPRAPLDAMDHDAIVRRITESNADVLLVALGNPKQDKWIAQHRSQLNLSLAIGVGCCFDLIAGRASRAPRWMQRSGLEWLYRLSREPRRLTRRYLVDAGWLLSAIPAVVWERVMHGVATAERSAT
jgi:N-acetylglucosaminyldiphosphoundecaprenol N-acetyl-beta-D-mannosaminyltransferase